MWQVSGQQILYRKGWTFQWMKKTDDQFQVHRSCLVQVNWPFAASLCSYVVMMVQQGTKQWWWGYKDQCGGQRQKHGEKWGYRSIQYCLLGYDTLETRILRGKTTNKILDCRNALQRQIYMSYPFHCTPDTLFPPSTPP